MSSDENRGAAVCDAPAPTTRGEGAESERSRFFGRVTAEFRTAVSGIIGMVDLCLDTNLDAEQRDYLSTTRDCAAGMLRVVRQIGELALIDGGRFRLEPTPFDLRAALAAATAAAAESAGRKGVKFVLGAAEGAPARVIGDEGRLRQVVQELAENAVRCTACGEVSVRAAWEPGAAGAGAGDLMLTVQDTGVGIPPDRLADIFLPFAARGGEAGVGLGLPFSRRVATAMGGGLEIASRVGVGTAAVCRVPMKAVESEAEAPASTRAPANAAAAAAAAAAAEPAEPAAAAAKSPAAKKILIVEDNPVNQKLAMKLLEKRGWGYAVASNGWEALDALAARDIDLVLMDLQMPQLGGVDAVRLLREREREVGGHVPVIALTANATPSERERCLSVGMDDFVAKPVRAEQLYAAIERGLSSAAAGPSISER